MTTRRTRIAVTIAAAGLLVVAGCTNAKEDPVQQLTHQQAIDLAEKLVKDNVAALKPQPQLEISGRVEAPCSGSNDDQETGQVMVERSYWLRGLDIGSNDQVFQTLTGYWDANGYKVTLDDGDSTSKGRKRVARHPENDFKVSLTQGTTGELSIKAQSSCVPEAK